VKDREVVGLVAFEPGSMIYGSGNVREASFNFYKGKPCGGQNVYF